MRVGLGWCWLVLAGLGLVTSQQTDHTNIQNLDLSPARSQLSASVDTLACGDMVDFSSRYLGDLYSKEKQGFWQYISKNEAL